ncbi:MAG: helix-turn-helix transcriptional regulator [Ruminococcus sp.]|nr:helix-turn-helix transcriptional regulator [Ruminococcus sp.]
MNIKSIGYDCVCGRDYSCSCKPERGDYMLLFAKSRFIADFSGIEGEYPENTVILYDDSAEINFRSDGFFVFDWIIFSLENENEFADAEYIEFNRPIFFSDSGLISQLMRNITEEYYSSGSRRLKMLNTMLKTVIIKAFEDCGLRDSVRQTADPHYSALVELREKIYRNPQIKWNVDLMAADVNMSRSYFQHIYKELFGVSCMSDVISGKIEKAKEILSETACTVSQVAAMCGYDNEEHFMRQFKKIVGVTPTSYRKKQ